ncbi:MAG: hypothetical protein U9O83_01080 [Campylobacterota bacterium]|nr:hypothetical protein [Campylobacterota bacterium]
MPKTVEELEALLKDANNKIDGLVDSKATILDEKKKLEKKYKEVDAEEYFNLRDKYETLESEHNKLQTTLKGKDKEVEKLMSQNDGLTATTNKYIIDNGISKELRGLERMELRDGGLELAIENIKTRFKPTNENGVLQFGDKSAKDFISDWATSEDSKFFLQAKENSGGGSNGGSGQGGAKTLSKMSESERNELYRSNPSEFNRLAGENK